MAGAVAIGSISNTMFRAECEARKGEPRRRQLVLLSPAIPFLADSRSELLDRYLKKSEENKAKNDKERVENYYKRNYGDYFRSLEGGLKQKKDLTDTEKGILEWLQKNG